MIKILVVEDDETVARMYQRIFNFEKYQVILASDGLDGLAKAKLELPSIILLDIMMPKLDGVATLEKLKADPQTSQIPVIMLTALGEEHIIKQCFEKGANGYIIKSALSPEQVVAEVKVYVGDDPTTHVE